jgi:hypothetical protein
MPNTQAVGVAYADPQLSSLFLGVSTVTATGSAQTDAAALGSAFTLVNGADGTKGVILPVAEPGQVIIVKNGAAAILRIYPASGAAVNALSANASYNIAASTATMLVAYSATQWYSLPLLAS